MHYDHPAHAHPHLAPRRRSARWLYLTLAVIIVVGGWVAFWFYAADRANQAIAGWLEREARVGRVYSCGSQSLGGFPFRIEVRCTQAGVELRQMQPAMSVRMGDILIAAQIYQPTLLIGEWSAPLTVSELGQSPRMSANWTLMQTSVRGRPRAPERISVVLDNPSLDQLTGGAPDRVASAKHTEIHARMASGSMQDRPVIDIAVRAAALVAPVIHPVISQPTDADIDLTLRGMKDLSAKPWPVRFREIQEAGGKIEVKTARIAQGEWLATGSGALGLTANGRLDGEIRVTIAGLEKLLQQIGVEYLSRPGAGSDKLNSAFNALDKIAPGLGNIARDRAAPALAAGAAFLGQATELEGRKAVALPLRFEDGKVYLGPLKVAETQPLF
jgi:hypothetical protein